MTSSQGSQSVPKAVVKPREISLEKRKGHEVLVVEDHLGQSFSCFAKEDKKLILENKETYLDNPFEIFYTVKDGRFLNFVDFGTPGDESEILEERIVPDRSESEGMDRKIGRQNAQQHASRVVGYMIEAGMFGSADFDNGTEMEDVEKEISSMLGRFVDRFEEDAKQGEWPDEL